MIVRFIPWRAGVPLELVQRVMGHQTTAVVLKHYFGPVREDFRAVPVQKMPKMSGNGSTPIFSPARGTGISSTRNTRIKFILQMRPPWKQRTTKCRCTQKK